MTSPLVLIVESHPVLSEVLADLLRLDEFETLLVSDGYQALNALHNYRPDLVIMNLHIAGEVGSLELLAAVRHHPQTDHMPVVLLVSDAIDQPIPADDDQLLIIRMLDLDHLTMAIRCLLLDRPRSAQRVASDSLWT